VVPGTDHDRGVLRYGWRTFTRHPREPRAELLQTSEAAWRFGEGKVPHSRGFGGVPVERRYLRRELPQAVPDGHG
jgi:hypothetical protein